MKKEIELENEELEREVFGGMTEKEYFTEKKWIENRNDILALSICFGLFIGFMLLAILLNNL